MNYVNKLVTVELSAIVCSRWEFLPVARVEKIQYSQYWKLLRSYDLEDWKRESARTTYVK